MAPHTEPPTSHPTASADHAHHTLTSSEPESRPRTSQTETPADMNPADHLPPSRDSVEEDEEEEEEEAKKAPRLSFDPDDARESEPSPDVNLDFPSTEDVTATLPVGGGEYVHPLAVAEAAPGRIYIPPHQTGSVRSRGRIPDPLEVMPFGDARQPGGTISGRGRRPPHSSYYNGPPPLDSAYGSDPVGQIGVHFPREILRIDRDYSGGELVQFHPTFPLELEGRVTPVQHQESMNQINEVLISAHRLFPSFLHNALGILTLYISTFIVPSHYDRELHRLRLLIDQLNREVYNPQGLNILWPQKSAFLFLEIEYY